MNIFHFVAFSSSTLNSGSERQIFTYLVSLERVQLGECSCILGNPHLGLWPAPDSEEIFKITKMGEYGALSVRNFLQLLASLLRVRLQTVSGCACGLFASGTDSRAVLNTCKI